MSVYTTVTKVELKHFLQNFDSLEVGEILSFSGIAAGMENTNYTLDTTHGAFILTLYEHYDATELPFFLDLMQHLSIHGVKTISPVSDKEGRILQSICGKPAALIKRLEGVALSPADVSTAHCEIIGDSLARFHVAGTSFKQFRPHDRHKDISPDIVNTLFPKLATEDQHLLQQELAHKQTINWQDLPSGIIHADLFCDNSIFCTVDNQPQLSGIIDLYLACNDAFIYDIAIVANDWCFELDGTFNATRCSAFLNAYHNVRPITMEEKREWLAMLRLSNLRFWISRLTISLFPPTGDMVMQKRPEELKQKLLTCRRNQKLIRQQIEGCN